jgi:hypothetical protein
LERDEDEVEETEED